ncbi:MAG: FtsB family cell division protein [Actinomycetota bacterium]
MSAGAVAAHARRRRVTGRAVALIVVVAALLVAATYPLRAYLHERSDIASLEHQVGVLQTTNSRLDDRIRQFQDPAYLERMARECLGMVKPGEIPFVVVPKHGKAGPRLC